MFFLVLFEILNFQPQYLVVIVFPLYLFMIFMLTTCTSIVKARKKYISLLSEMLQVSIILRPITEITDT